MEIKITEPALSGTVASERGLEEMLRSENEIYGLEFTGQVACRAAKDYLSVSNAVFRQCVFSGSVFLDTQLSDVVFEHCDLSNLELRGGLVRVRFADCRMTGMSLIETKLTQVAVSRCGWRYAGFSFVRSRGLLFSACDLREGLFNDCGFERLGFVKCRLGESVFHRSSLRGVDLRDSDTVGLQAGPDDLKGAVITSLQAIEFSRLLGVVVRD